MAGSRRRGRADERPPPTGEPTVVVVRAQRSDEPRLLQQLHDQHPGAVQRFQPERPGATLVAGAARWSHHAAVAVFDLPRFDRLSLAPAVRALELSALRLRKTLLIVVRGDHELSDAGVRLHTAAVVVDGDDISDGPAFTLDHGILRLHVGQPHQTRPSVARAGTG